MRRPQPGDQRQDFVEHLTRHRDLGHLERDVPPWLTTLAPSLISFSRKLVSDHGSAALGIASVRMKLSQIVGQYVELEAHRVAAKGPARQPRPLDCTLALLDRLLAVQDAVSRQADCITHALGF